jgi:membrane protein
MTVKKGAQFAGIWIKRWRSVVQVLWPSLCRFLEDDSLTIAASIAFYSLLAIFPFLLLLLALVGIFIRQYELSGQLVIVLNRYLPMKPDFIMRNLVSISKAYGPIGLSSLMLLLWSSSGVFVPLERALNIAWEVQEDRSWWRSRLLAMELALLGGLLTVISLGIVGLRPVFHHWLHHSLPGRTPLLIDLAYTAFLAAWVFATTFSVFLILFRYLPNRKLAFREVFPSALLTTLLWEISRWIFTRLLRHFHYSHIYGSIGAMVSLMTWAYVSAAVMLLGARMSHDLYRALYPPEPTEDVMD